MKRSKEEELAVVGKMLKETRFDMVLNAEELCDSFVACVKEKQERLLQRMLGSGKLTEEPESELSPEEEAVDAYLDEVGPALEADDINRRLRVLQHEIRNWSETNFGQNVSKTDDHVCLDGVGSLLGVVEELGEYLEGEGMLPLTDALADITIYLCDYAARTDTRIEVTAEQIKPAAMETILGRLGVKNPKTAYTMQLAILIGKLAHINLKRHQGIRGYEHKPKFDAENKQLVSEIFIVLSQVSSFHVLPLAERTWEKVKQRNWKTNPANADQVVEAAAS